MITLSWNPVLNKFIEIKNAYISTFSKSRLWDYDPSKTTCLEYWVERLNKPEYIELIKPLQLIEHRGLLLVRYGNYADVFGGEDDVTPDEFWDKYDGFYLECRSVVIDIIENRLAVTPFKKFRNLDECEETSIENISKRIRDAKCVEFSDKLDGSMQAVRYYNDNIVMCGSTSLNPESSWRLKDGYKMLFNRAGYIDLIMDNPLLTFIFEYISMKDAHVVVYSKEQEGLYLIGIRNSVTGEEYSYKTIKEFADKYSIPSTTVFNKTLDDVIKELDDKKSNEAEGFVVNIDGYKVKIKYNDYVNMHRVLSEISSVNLVIRNIADGTFDDMISKVPTAYKDRVLKTANVVFKYIHNTELEIKDCFDKAPKDDKKEFMVWVETNVPSRIKAYVREKYYGKEYNLIKSKSGRYMKLCEMETKDNE